MALKCDAASGRIQKSTFARFLGSFNFRLLQEYLPRATFLAEKLKALSSELSGARPDQSENLLDRHGRRYQLLRASSRLGGGKHGRPEYYAFDLLVLGRL